MAEDERREIFGEKILDKNFFNKNSQKVEELEEQNKETLRKYWQHFHIFELKNALKKLLFMFLSLWNKGCAFCLTKSKSDESSSNSARVALIGESKLHFSCSYGLNNRVSMHWSVKQSRRIQNDSEKRQTPWSYLDIGRLLLLWLRYMCSRSPRRVTGLVGTLVK